MALAIAYLFSQHHINLYYYQWAALVVVVCLLFKNTRGSSDPARLKAWFTIGSFQLLLFALFYGVSNYFGPHTFTQVILYNTAQLGFAPWGLMLLVATLLRMVMQRTGKDTSPIEALRQFVNIEHGSRLWILLNLSFRLSTNAIIGITLALLCLNMVDSISAPFEPFSMLSVIISFLIMLLALVKKFEPLFKLIVNNKNYLYLTLPATALVLALCIGALSYLLSGLGNTLTQTPGIVILLNATYANTLTPLLFGQSWWVAWSVVGGVFIAHKARHIDTREIILISAIVPILIFVLISTAPVRTALTTHNWSVIIGFLATAGLFKLLFQRDMLPLTIINYLPTVAQPKQRSHPFYMIKVIKIVLMILFFTIPIGAQVPAFFSSMVVVPFILISLSLLWVGLKI